MSQITHFYGVKFLAWKPGSVKFWTNIMSVWQEKSIFDRKLIWVFLPSLYPQKFNQKIWVQQNN